MEKNLSETVARLVRELEEARSRISRLEERLSETRDRQDGQNDTLFGLQGVVEAQGTSLADLTQTVLGALNGYEEPEGGVPEDETDEQRSTRVGLLARVDELETLVRARNRSAAVIRNMTNLDAERVMIGDAKDLGHKEAGLLVGLTYAQVYSARLEYTFKDVHKKLRDAGWKNPWAKR